MALTLHEAMVLVLDESAGTMHAEDLARVIAERDLYRRGDGQHPSAQQLRARARKYPQVLSASDDGSGLISLAGGTAEAFADLVVFCADVGSVSNGRFGWARSKLRDQSTDVHDTSKPADLVRAVTAELAAGRPVALGFECPLFVPVPVEQLDLGRARSGEGNRSWSAGAGTGALATGLVQAAWILEALRRKHTNQQVWMNWSAFAAARTGLLLWEAFVSASAKGTSHVDDAAIAVAAFIKELPNPDEASTIEAERPLSLIGAAALWSGWSADEELLRAVPLVIKAE